MIFNIGQFMRIKPKKDITSPLTNQNFLATKFPVLASTTYLNYQEEISKYVERIFSSNNLPRLTSEYINSVSQQAHKLFQQIALLAKSSNLQYFAINHLNEYLVDINTYVKTFCNIILQPYGQLSITDKESTETSSVLVNAIKIAIHFDCRHVFYAPEDCPKQELINHLFGYQVHILRNFGYTMEKISDQRVKFLAPSQASKIDFTQIDSALDEFFKLARAFEQMPKPLAEFINFELTNIYLAGHYREAISKDGEKVECTFITSRTRTSYYLPESQKPFFIKGVWIPETAGQLFSIAEVGFTHMLRRVTHQGINEILFLIHPESESMYLPLIEKYSNKQLNIPALALSSLRTLLIAIPNNTNSWDYAMAKLSLNERSGKTLRVLSLNEAAGSIGNSLLFGMQLPPSLSIMDDLFSFVPNPNLIDHTKLLKPGPDSSQGYGMIVRPIPEFLLQESSQYRLIPLYAILGINSTILDAMIAKSGLTSSKFIEVNILIPFADLILKLLFDKSISIEAHAQNLLWIINADSLQPVKFMYRDMGGVNIGETNHLIVMHEHSYLAKLPDNLNKREYYYRETHINDAANAIEVHFIGVLFSLTKRFVKLAYHKQDEEFYKWHKVMQEEGKLLNWTSAEANNDAHPKSIPANLYVRYGYFELKFAKILLAQLEHDGIKQQIISANRDMKKQFDYYEQASNNNMCKYWFGSFIYDTYSAYLALRNSLRL